MKLDYDCIRYILLKIEELDYDSSNIYLEDIVNETYDFPTVSYHIDLLLDNNYVEAKYMPILGARYKQFIIKRMTMQGHEYLSVVRDNGVWAKTKNELKKVSGYAPFDIVKTVATKFSLDILGF